MEIHFTRKDLADIFAKASRDIRSNYGNEWGNKLLTTAEEINSNFLEKIADALYFAPSED